MRFILHFIEIIYYPISISFRTKTADYTNFQVVNMHVWSIQCIEIWYIDIAMSPQSWYTLLKANTTWHFSIMYFICKRFKYKVTSSPPPSTLPFYPRKCFRKNNHIEPVPRVLATFEGCLNEPGITNKAAIPLYFVSNSWLVQSFVR